MKYMASSPRRAFMKYVKAISRKTKEASILNGMSPELRQMVYCAAIVECSASMECYIENVFCSWIQNADKYADNGAIPFTARAFIFGKQCEQSVVTYILKNDDKDFISSMCSADKSYIFDHEKINKAQIINSAIRDVKYPSVKNIKKLFIRFGINNIFDLMSEKLRTDSKLLLKSLMDIRCSVVHSYPAAEVFSSEDVHIHMINSRRIVRSIDSVLHGLIIDTSCSNCWP